jgi:hypothetical protein
VKFCEQNLKIDKIHVMIMPRMDSPKGFVKIAPTFMSGARPRGDKFTKW